MARASIRWKLTPARGAKLPPRSIAVTRHAKNSDNTCASLPSPQPTTRMELIGHSGKRSRTMLAKARVLAAGDMDRGPSVAIRARARHVAALNGAQDRQFPAAGRGRRFCSAKGQERRLLESRRAGPEQRRRPKVPPG